MEKHFFLLPIRHRVDTCLVNEPLLPWSLRESVWARGMAHPQVIGSDHLPVRLTLPGLLNAAGHAAMPAPYRHTEGRLLPYDAEAAPVGRCLWAAVTAAQDEPSLAPWLGPAEQRAYGSMPATAVDKVFEHLHAAHDALARLVGRRQPSPTGPHPAEGDPAEGGKRLQAAILRYDALAACAPAAYQANAARHGIHSDAALRLTEGLRGASPRFGPTTQGQLQEELEKQAATVEEEIGQLRALLAADRKSAIKDFWRRHAQDIAQRWKAVRGDIEVEVPGPSGLWNVRVPNTQTLLTEAHDVMSAVGAFWREQYDKRPVDLPVFQAVLGRHVPRVPEGAWAKVQQHSMRDLQSALDKADGKAPGPNHLEAGFIKALPMPVQWLLVHSYRAVLRGAPPPAHWRDAHILLSPKVPGSARLDDYRPIAQGQLDMKLLTGPLTQRITEVLTRQGVVSDWQQGALPGSNTGPALFMAQRQLQQGKAQLRLLLRRPQGLRHRPARRPPPHPAPPLRTARDHRPPALPPHMRQAAHRHRTRADTARPHAAPPPARQPRKPPAVRATPGASAPSPGTPPVPSGKALVLQRGGDRCGLAQPRGACVAGGRAGHQACSLWNASHTTAYGGVGLVLSYTGLVGRGRVGVSPAPSTNTVISPTSKSLSGGCRRWSAASSSDTPPGYVARAWFRYRAAPPGQRVLRACSRAGALLWTDVAGPVPVSRNGLPPGQGPAGPVGRAPLHPVAVEGRLQPPLGRCVPRVIGAHPADHGGTWPGVRPPPFDRDGGVLLRGGPRRACGGTPPAPLARPFLAHYTGLPWGHGAAPDDPRREEGRLQVLRETLGSSRYGWGSSCGGNLSVPRTTRREATKPLSGRGGGGGDSRPRSR